MALSYKYELLAAVVQNVPMIAMHNNVKEAKEQDIKFIREEYSTEPRIYHARND